MTKRFIFIELILYLMFMTIDLFTVSEWFSRVSVLLKISSIALCSLYVVAIHTKHKTKDTHLMRIILLFTLASDVVLLLTRYFSLGIIFFILVQVLYGYRITRKERRLFKTVVFLAIAIGFAMFYSIKKNTGYGGLVEIGIFYAVLFIWNIIELATADGGRFTNKRFFFVGLVLYAICDIHVLIYNFPSYFQSNALLQLWYGFSGMGMWLFYLPGQVLLSLSAQRDGDSVS